MKKIKKSDSEWKRSLSAEAYTVTRLGGTEPAFTGAYWNNHRAGVYACVCCGLPLFSSDAKYESGSGWPSFFRPIAPENVESTVDESHGMVRDEVRCPRCGAHLGHVFNDGPKPTGLRYCTNSAALTFAPAAEPVRVAAGVEKAGFAAGCFWGVEDGFSHVNGVLSTTVGYMGGHTESPTYEQVCTGLTGHAETVLVEYDPSIVNYRELLDIFWKIHDPTTLNRQGPDVGTQYRSAIFWYSPGQREEAVASMERLASTNHFSRRVVTEVVEAKTFWRAEEYHQKYFEKRGVQGCAVRV